MDRIISKINQTIPELPKKKRVAAYARVSSGKETMIHSLSAQISYYSDYIQNHTEWSYMGVYADSAITGTKDTRSEFQRLLADCRAGKIDMVITKSISRFARNTIIMLEVVRKLKSLNIGVYFEKENINSLSGDGELMLTILASFAQEESRSVSENCKWRIRKRFSEGEPVNLRIMYGYKISKGKIEIESEQAEIVKKIFNDYINGIPTADIARKLRYKKVPTLRGGTWTSTKINYMLKNEKYTGNSLLQKKFLPDHLSKTPITNKGELPKYYAEGTHPGIINEKTFNKAQEILERNRQNNARDTTLNIYPFTSMIVCSKCGKNYMRKSSKTKVTWNCGTYLKFGKAKCHTKQIPNDILEKLTAKVLGIKKFDADIFKKQIKQIHIPAFNKVTFVFFDGQMVKEAWQDKSRKWIKEQKKR